MSCTGFSIHSRPSAYIYISNLTWFDQNSRKITYVGFYVSGCIQWNVRMMVTWPIIKMVYIKVEAQNCIELYSIVLPRYDVKDFSHYLFFFNLLHSSPWKQHERMGFWHILKTKTRGYNCCIMGKLTQKGKCILFNRKKLGVVGQCFAWHVWVLYVDLKCWEISIITFF